MLVLGLVNVGFALLLMETSHARRRSSAQGGHKAHNIDGCAKSRPTSHPKAALAKRFCARERATHALWCTQRPDVTLPLNNPTVQDHVPRAPKVAAWVLVPTQHESLRCCHTTCTIA